MVSESVGVGLGVGVGLTVELGEGVGVESPPLSLVEHAARHADVSAIMKMLVLGLCAIVRIGGW